VDIDLTDFSTAQQQALLDLLTLAMYADGQPLTVENKLLQTLFTAMGHTAVTDCQHELEAAVTRISPSIQSVQKAKKLASVLAEAFTSRDQHKRVYAAVQKMMASDKHVSSWESTLLSELRLKFRL